MAEYRAVILTVTARAKIRRVAGSKTDIKRDGKAPGADWARRNEQNHFGAGLGASNDPEKNGRFSRPVGPRERPRASGNIRPYTRPHVTRI